MIQYLPNIISSARILLSFVFLYLYMLESFEWRLLGVVVFTIAAVSDALDGYLARHYNVATRIGVFLDPLADKFLTFCGFFSLPLITTGVFEWWPIILIVIRDISITLLRIWAESKGFTMETRNSAKVKTTIQMGFLYVALLFGLFLTINVPLLKDFSLWLFYGSATMTGGLYLAMAVTVYTGIEYIVVNRELFVND